MKSNFIIKNSTHQVNVELQKLEKERWEKVNAEVARLIFNWELAQDPWGRGQILVPYDDGLQSTSNDDLYSGLVENTFFVNPENRFVPDYCGDLPLALNLCKVVKFDKPAHELPESPRYIVLLCLEHYKFDMPLDENDLEISRFLTTEETFSGKTAEEGSGAEVLHRPTGEFVKRDKGDFEYNLREAKWNLELRLKHDYNHLRMDINKQGRDFVTEKLPGGAIRITHIPSETGVYCGAGNIFENYEACKKDLLEHLRLNHIKY